MRDSFAVRSGVEYVEKDGTYIQTYPEPEPAPWGVFAPQGGLPLFIFATKAEAKAKVETLNTASLTGGFAYGQAGIDW